MQIAWQVLEVARGIYQKAHEERAAAAAAGGTAPATGGAGGGGGGGTDLELVPRRSTSTATSAR